MPYAHSCPVGPSSARGAPWSSRVGATCNGTEGRATHTTVNERRHGYHPCAGSARIQHPRGEEAQEWAVGFGGPVTPLEARLTAPDLLCLCFVDHLAAGETFETGSMTFQASRQCACCGDTFTALHASATYCSNRCKSRAYQRRRGSRGQQTQLVLHTGGVEVREWQGHPIQRRQPDGYVNATAMCQAGGKRWNDYSRMERTTEYISALTAVAGIPVTDLVDLKQGGRPDEQGTWIHPRLAVDLARWVSPAFAVWMDGWFLESLGAPAAPAVNRRDGELLVAAADDVGRALLKWSCAVARAAC